MSNCAGYLPHPNATLTPAYRYASRTLPSAPNAELEARNASAIAVISNLDLQFDSLKDPLAFFA
jgi:hypothetical protein